MNKVIGILIIVLYFGNYHICNLVYYNDLYKWYQLKYSILALIVILALKYQQQKSIYEKLFISIVINNIYVLLYKNETSYTLNDLWFVAILTASQYINIEQKNDKVT